MADLEDRIIKVNIEEEMQSSYIDYSMSVIVARALPDVRDGFKPVHRRILFGMKGLGNTHDKAYKKSVRVVGDVLGKYHPHGDSSVYGALVRMAQDWNLRYTLVDGQGNFGSVDGDSPAAMRYTEVRLTQLGESMMQDIDKETVDMQNNFDDTLQEPTVMPTRIPSFLVNGASGIAVGMATNVPTHNLREVIDACVAYVDNKDIDVDGLMQYIKAPDFPTGGFIFGMSGVKSAYETGRGRIVMRARAEIETEGEHDKIVVNEIPYGVNKKELIMYIAQLVKEGKVTGISNVNDESDKEGMRIVVDLKRDANANVILNKLFKLTALQTSFSVNCIALVGGRPKLLTLKDCIKYFVEHRHDVVIRRTKYLLKKALERIHIIQGLIIASDNIDEIVHIIKAAKTPQLAIESICTRFGLDDIQARAIVEMRLRQLTGLMQDQLHEELDELEKQVEYYNSILNDENVCSNIIKEELLEVKEKYGDDRRSEIMYSDEEFNPEDFYADDKVVITLSHLGYIKRTPLAEYHSQGRGGVGSRGGSTRNEDFIEYMYHATMHNTMLLFTQKGRCYWLKAYDIPEGTKVSKGRAIQNMLNLASDDSVNACLHIKNLSDPQFCETHYVVFCTKNGVIKKTSLKEYSRPRANGVNAINIQENDRVVSVCLTRGDEEILVADKEGHAIRFNENTVRSMGRNATGVRAMRIENGNEVVGMVSVCKPEEETVLVVSNQGYGKRSNVEDYRITNRGGKGVKTMNITEKTGQLVALKVVTDDDDLMIINISGITLRIHVSDLRVMGRAAQGVRLINLEKRGDKIASICRVPREEEEETDIENAETPNASNETPNASNETPNADNAEVTEKNPETDE